MAKRSVYKETISALHVLNIVGGAIFNLIFQIGIFIGIGWLLIKYCEAPEWVYAPLVAVGALSGIYSMIKLILSACKNLERLEREKDRGEEPPVRQKANAERKEDGRVD